MFALALLVSVPSASAATVRFEEVSLSFDGSVVYYSGGPGEANRVTGTLDSTGSKLTIIDPNVVILPVDLATVSHCSFAVGRVVCSTAEAGGIAWTNFGGEDGNDRVTLAGGAPGELHGGDGRDALQGSSGWNELYGGPGADDQRGGGGRDTALYLDHAGPVTVDLDDAADDGSPGEGDNVHSDVEDLSGTFDGGDTLTGNEGANAFLAFGGSDVLTGAGGDDWLQGDDGNDTIDGGLGTDLLVGGFGDDTITSNDGVADDVRCNQGTDTVFADLLDSLADCENVTTS